MKPTSLPTPAVPSYKRDVIDRFLCTKFGVSHLGEMTPFGRAAACWEVMRPVTLTVEAKIPSGTQIDLTAQPESQKVSLVLANVTKLDSHLPPTNLIFKHPQTQKPMEVNLDCVYPFSVITRHVRSNVPLPLGVRLNFYHESLNVLEKHEEQDDLLAIGGAIKGAYTSVAATPPYGEDVEIAGLKRRHFSYCNEFFASTMALINEDNLKNGIVEIPADVCREAGLLLFEGAPEPPKDWEADEAADEAAEALASMDISDGDRAARFKAEWMAQAEKRELYPILHYYAVPINHVLAWGLHSKEYAAQHKVHREEFTFTPPVAPKGSAGTKGPKVPSGDILLYYLVSNVSMRAMRANFDKHWLGKVDSRPLNSMGFDFVPFTGARHYPGLAPEVKQVTVDTFSVRSTFSYMVAPKLSRAQIAALAPTLSPTFPSCRDWDPKEAARQRDLERYLK